MFVEVPLQLFAIRMKALMIHVFRMKSCLNEI